MKKTAAMIFILLAALLCTGTSVWEGAAAVSLSGELPEEGYYVATKSFPRNTVVDVTNLETGRSIRVIVAASLDSPGLLAILSRDTARVIGLQNRSIGRIRMTMPSDPIAFSRFNQGIIASGDPDFDPRAALAAAGLSSDYGPEGPSFSVPAPSVPGEPVPDPAAFLPQGDPPQEAARPAIPPNPAALDLVVDLPPPEEGSVLQDRSGEYPVFSTWGWEQEAASAPPEAAPAEDPFPPVNVVEAWPPEMYPEPVPEPAAPPPAEISRSGTPPEEAAAQSGAAAPAEVAAGVPPDEEAAPFPPGNVMYQPSQTEYAPDPSRGGTLYLPPPPRPDPPPPLPPEYRISLVPADSRTPEYSFGGLPEGLEIPPIPDRFPGAAPPQEVRIPEELFIPPIPERRTVPENRVLEPLIPPIAERAAAPQPGTREPSPSEIIPPVGGRPQGGTPAAPAETSPPPPAGRAETPRTERPDRAGEFRFSAPLIRGLERGKYYLQLGAFRQPELLEDELLGLGNSWPLAVQKAGTEDQPLYRLLVGPVNRGESAALLERFRARGYGDAFVRQN